jgi:membrane protease YdiL (CAAX protease family)
VNTPDPRAGSGVAWDWRESLLLVVAAHVALIVVGGIVVGNRAGQPDPIPVGTQLLATLPFWIAAVGGSWWLVRERSGRSADSPSVPVALGLSLRPIDVPVGIVVGVVMQWVVIPVVYWPLLKVLGERRAELERPARELVESVHGAGPIVMLFLLTCVGAPLAEELLYRGVLQRGAGRTNALVGVAVAAFVFGVAHLQPLQFVGLALFGGASGLLVWRTGRLGPGMVAHVAFNASTVIPLLVRR